jgi:hypothetical protein
MNDILKTAEKDLLAVPENIKRTLDKVKKETFVQTDAETGEADAVVPGA